MSIIRPLTGTVSQKCLTLHCSFPTRDPLFKCEIIFGMVSISWIYLHVQKLRLRIWNVHYLYDSQIFKRYFSSIFKFLKIKLTQQCQRYHGKTIRQFCWSSLLFGFLNWIIRYKVFRGPRLSAYGNKKIKKGVIKG